MESNWWDSSESSFNYRGSSSESNMSRNSYQDRYSLSSESASESRSVTYEDWLKTDPWIARGGLSSASEMHQAYQEWANEQRGRISMNGYDTSLPKKKYNSLEDIDKLIEKLEKSTENISVKSEKINRALMQRKQKIFELKKLVSDARKEEEERKIIKQLEKENNELDEAIESFNKGLYR